MNPFLAFDLIQPGLQMALGLGLMWLPHKYRQRAQGRQAARLAELDAGDDEHFFEERRSLEAYPPSKSDRVWQLLGAVALLGGSIQMYDLFTH